MAYFENQPSFFIVSIEVLWLGLSPLATKTPTFSPTVSAISATPLCVNLGQSRTAWMPSSLTSFLQTSTASLWFLTTTTNSLYLPVSIMHLCFSASASTSELKWQLWVLKETTSST